MHKLGTTLLAASACMWTASASADAIAGYAAMGASESAGNTYSGSWVPFLADRGFNFGADNGYNVAIGGATSATLLQQGQHTTVANLVTEGNVDLAYLFVGANDFNLKGSSIANGNLHGQALTDFINGVVTNIQTATDTVLAAGPVGMVISGLPDLLLTPGGRQLYDTSMEQERGTAAIDQMNAALRPMVLSRWLPLVDVATAMRNLNAGAPLVVGGVTIDLANPSPDPTHFFQDQIHPGTIGNGFLANLMLTAVNLAYGTSFTPFSDLEILTRAGLAGSYTAQTSNVDYAKYVILPLVGDANGDRIVDVSDLQSVAAHWLEHGPLGDTNRSGLVDISDLQAIALHWLESGAGGGSAAAPVPEPSAWLMMLVGGLAVLKSLSSRRCSAQYL